MELKKLTTLTPFHEAHRQLNGNFTFTKRALKRVEYAAPAKRIKMDQSQAVVKKLTDNQVFIVRLTKSIDIFAAEMRRPVGLWSSGHTSEPLIG